MVPRCSTSVAVVCAGLLAACQGEGESPAPEDQRPPARVRRLSVREYTRSIAALLDISVPPQRFLDDSLDTGYDNGPAALTVQPEQAEAYEEVAWEVAELAVREHRDLVLGECDPARAGVPACRDAVLDHFARRALRRPLGASERARYAALFDGAAAQAGFDEALQTVIAALLQSPAFLYRTEVGAPRPGARRVALEPLELASQLSFLLTGLPPDDELLELAESGALARPDTLRAQAERLLAEPAARGQLAHFLDQWLGTSPLAGVQKSAPVFAELRPAMRTELDRFYEYILFDSPGRSLDELLSSPVLFVDGALAAHYQVPVATGRRVFRVALARQHRRGVLTRAGFLSVHSGHDSSNPIARGVFLRSALLCAPPPAPPAGIPRVPAADGPARTTRERYAAHTGEPFCQSCHAAIDGLGFGFEAFDGTGALRTSENGVPIDASGLLLDAGEMDGPFVGVTELADRLRHSHRLSDCFARHLVRFAMGAAEQAGDEPYLRWLGEDFAPEQPIVDLLLRLVTSPHFSEREVEP
jgi:hypothetical protein